MHWRLHSIAIAAALLILPFVLRADLIDPALLPRLLIASALATALGLLLFAKASDYRASAEQLPFLRPMPLALIIYAGWLTLAAVAAPLWAEALFEGVRVWLWVIFAWLFAVVLVRDRRAFGIFSRALVLVALGLLAVGLLQFYGVAFEQLPGNRPPQATMVNRNLLGSALCLLTPFALYTCLRRNALWRGVALVAMAGIAALIMLLNNRASWLALSVSALVSGAVVAISYRHLRLSPSQKRLYTRRLALAAAVVLVVAAVFGSPILRRDQQSVADRMAAATVLGEGSVAERLTLWKRSLAMLIDNPVLGVGPGYWRVAYAAEGLGGVPSEDGITFYQRPHNDYLWVGAESGVLALLAYAAIALTAALVCITCLRRSTDKDDILISAVMLFGLIAWGVVSLFGFPKERMVHLMLTGLMLGSVWATHARMHPSRRFGRISVRPIAMAIVCLGVVSGAIAWERMDSESHVAKALEARRRGDWRTVIREIDSAQSSLMPLDPTSTPLVWYRGVGHYSSGDFDAAQRDFEHAYRVNPYHIHVLNSLAACHERRENHLEAERFYLESLRVAPGYTDTRINLAAVYYNWGRYSDALTAIGQVPDSVNDAKVTLYKKQIEDRLRESDGAGAH